MGIKVWECYIDNIKGMFEGMTACKNHLPTLGVGFKPLCP